MFETMRYLMNDIILLIGRFNHRVYTGQYVLWLYGLKLIRSNMSNKRLDKKDHCEKRTLFDRLVFQFGTLQLPKWSR